MSELSAPVHYLRDRGKPAHYRCQAGWLPSGLVRAFDKRQVETADLDRITTEIEQTIQNSLEREVSTDKIGQMVMERIKPLDEVAYIRFASVYRRFQDVNEFIQEINAFRKEK